MRRTLTVAGVWAVVVVMLMMGGFSLAGPATVPRPGSGIASERTGAPGTALPHGASSTTHVATTAVRDIHAAEYSPRAPSRSMATSTAASPGCSSQPCPMGITDYGVTPSLGSYTYRTNEVESFVDISTLHVNQSNGASCLDGNAAWCMGFQSNWVTEGVKVHNVAHDYWTQDVAQVAYDSSCSSPCVSGTYSVTWLDNIWNFSAPGCTSLTGKGCMNAGDLTGNGHLRCSSHGGAPTFYYCVGATVYDLRLPFTVWTFMSVGTNGGTPSKSQVNFYGAVVKGNAYHYGFTYDTVNFTSGSAGGGTPMFQVKNSNTPYGIPFDGEWDICGPAGGASVTIGSIAATLESYYYHAGWVSIKHAWSSGYDTAESAYYVNLYAFGGFRYTASAATGTENPATSLW